jgi:signal transduction histidine kinase
MKSLMLVFGLCLGSIFCSGQKINIDSIQVSVINLFRLDSLVHLLESAAEDTTKANLLGTLSYQFAFTQADKSVMYGQQGVQLSQKLGYRKGVAYCSQSLAMGLWGMGNYSNALQVGFTALHLYEELMIREDIALTHYVLSNVYRDFGDYKRALEEVKKGFEIYKALEANDIIGHAIMGSIYDLKDQLDSAFYNVQKAFELNKAINNEKWGWLYYLQGNIYRKQMQYDSAMHYYRTALPLVDNKDLIETYNGIAILYDETGRIDSCIYYASQVVQKWKYVSYQRGILQATNILADAYKKINQRDSAIKYFELSVALNNTMFNQQHEREIQNMAFNEQLREDEEIRNRKEFQDTIKMYALVTIGIFLLAVALLLWRNVRHKKRANVLLLQQKSKVEETLQMLRATQSQLIQSEKMASLGELTAGIAHEIQNPLNFVNNFSEVNKELLAELNDEVEKGNFTGVQAIAKDLKDNEDKIIHHGKRADAIVKGMLQHSRSSSGVKELTDINALADEYLRLSYHGFRAKDKNFNSKLETDFDSSLQKINVVPQDIGRAILNLLNNAFYAANEKKYTMGDSYEPTVLVTTRKINNNVLIHVKDNGNGISQKALDKVFQPFFTTKPPGQGTGLGLSLSYDIVKAHGGELKVDTTEGQGSEFIIVLPI